MRRWLFVLAIALSPNWASCQGAVFLCRFDEGEAVVLCLKEGVADPVFRYKLQIPNTALFANLASSSNENEPVRKARERCRSQTEELFDQELEDKFNNSWEGLRIATEKLRKDNFDLYKQVVIVYRGLREYYESGRQAYRDAQKACTRITPYPVHPSHT
jgi:hypothetical protein